MEINDIEQFITSKSIFIYIVIFCCCVVYFRNINVTIGTFVGLIFATLCILYLHYREIHTNIDEIKLNDMKHEYLIPNVDKFKKYIDITDFLFSIQDFRIYNYISYDKMSESIETFINVYESVMNDYSLASDLYSIADAQKLLSLNYLHSIIIIMPSSKLLIKKHNEAMKVLEKILNKYLMEIYEENQRYIKENGYYTDTKVIELNIQPSNKYRTYDKYTKIVDDKYY